VNSKLSDQKGSEGTLEKSIEATPSAIAKKVTIDLNRFLTEAGTAGDMEFKVVFVNKTDLSQQGNTFYSFNIIRVKDKKNNNNTNIYQEEAEIASITNNLREGKISPADAVKMVTQHKYSKQATFSIGSLDIASLLFKSLDTLVTFNFITEDIKAGVKNRFLEASEK
jgi:hypothetical protein